MVFIVVFFMREFYLILYQNEILSLSSFYALRRHLFFFLHIHDISRSLSITIHKITCNHTQNISFKNIWIFSLFYLLYQHIDMLIATIQVVHETCKKPLIFILTKQWSSLWFTNVHFLFITFSKHP